MSEHTSETVERGGFDRREALKKAAVAGGIVWAAPMIMSSPARAQATPCTPKCAPSEQLISFAGSSVLKSRMPGSDGPDGQAAIRHPGELTVTATQHVPVHQLDAHVHRHVRLPFTSPNPGQRLPLAPVARSLSSAPTSTGPSSPRRVSSKCRSRITGNCQPQHRPAHFRRRQPGRLHHHLRPLTGDTVEIGASTVPPAASRDPGRRSESVPSAVVRRQALGSAVLEQLADSGDCEIGLASTRSTGRDERRPVFAITPDRRSLWRLSNNRWVDRRHRRHQDVPL